MRVGEMLARFFLRAGSAFNLASSSTKEEEKVLAQQLGFSVSP
jgi:hypothetical protein